MPAGVRFAYGTYEDTLGLPDTRGYVDASGLFLPAIQLSDLEVTYSSFSLLSHRYIYYITFCVCVKGFDDQF